MKQLLIFALFLALGIQIQAQTFPPVTRMAYPGTVTIIKDGDLIRVSLSQAIPGVNSITVNFQEWYTNVWSGLQEMSTGTVYVSANLMSQNNIGINAFVPQIRIPLQLVTTVGNQSQYLASIKGDTLFTTGTKTGWQSKWNIKLFLVAIQGSPLVPTGYISYETGWIPVNIASLPAMDSQQFYSGVIFNPIQPNVPLGKQKGPKK